MKTNIKSIRSNQIGSWVKQGSSFIAAVPKLFSRSWSEMGLSDPIEVHSLVVKALWRIGRRPGQALTLDSLKQALERDNILKEVSKQESLEEGKGDEKDERFVSTRRQLITSVVRKAGVQDVEGTTTGIEAWLHLIPHLRNTRQIMNLTRLFIEQQGALRIVATPVEVASRRGAELAVKSPTRVVQLKRGTAFIVLKAGEQIDWNASRLQIAKAA